MKEVIVMSNKNYTEYEVVNPRYWIDNDLNIRDRYENDEVIGTVRIVEVDDK